MALTLEEKLNRYPPNVVRLFARTSSVRGKRKGYRRRALTTAEIAASSGLDEATVRRLSFAPIWAGVPVDVMLAYLRGCGADFNDPLWMAETKQLGKRCVRQEIWPAYVTMSPEYHEILKPIIDSLAGAAKTSV